MTTQSDVAWMTEALSLAERGAGHTAPNPMVGAIVVNKGRAVAHGWHQGPGCPHAEVAALDRAADLAVGATLYVTLEPCSHHGRTPPCVDRILASGVVRVVAAMRDPNPIVDGRGFSKLRAAGLSVTQGVLAREATLLNRAFVTWVTQRRPYVQLKVAESLDGKVATHTGESQWITTEAARQDGHRLRSRVDAILVGIGTALADDPRLTARPADAAAPRQPMRVVVDSRARLPLRARCLNTEGGSTVVAATRRAPQPKLKALREQGVRVWTNPHDGEVVDLPLLVKALAEWNVTHLLVEGGPGISGAFADAGLVDEVVVYVAPILIGGASAPGALGGRGVARLAQATALTDAKWVELGGDLRFTGRVRRSFLEG